MRNDDPLPRFVSKQFYVTGEENLIIRDYARRRGITLQNMFSEMIQGLIRDIETDRLLTDRIEGDRLLSQMLAKE